MASPQRRDHGWLAALTVVATATIAPELFTGNTPPAVLVQPGMLAFLVLSYGLPVLALRELSLRFRTGPLGLFVSGLAYGLLNEGVLAKTIFRSHLPIDRYDGYAVAVGVAWPWALFIISWHAVASVVLPVLLAHTAFPRVAGRPLLPRWAATTLPVPILALGTVIFLQPGGEHLGTPAELAVLLAAIVVIVALSTRVRSRWHPARPVPNLIVGFSGFIAVAGLAVLAVSRVPLPFWLLGMLAVLGYGWLTTRKGASVWLVVGFHAQTAALPVALALAAR